MRIDSFGVVHPEPKDEPNLVGMLHVHECGPCRVTFAEAEGPVVLERIDELVATLEREQREKAKVRRAKR